MGRTGTTGCCLRGICASRWKRGDAGTAWRIPVDEPEIEDRLREWGWNGSVWRLRRRMEVPEIGGPVAAFCGIARPDQFFEGLEKRGCRLAARCAFRRSSSLCPSDVESLRCERRGQWSHRLDTTEKDLVRLGKLMSAFPASLDYERPNCD